MRPKLVVVLTVFAAALAAATVNADVVVAIHGHSNFSDGMKPLRETYVEMCSGGAEVAIVTDHTEVIDLPQIPASFLKMEFARYSHWEMASGALLKEAGLANWKAAYRSLQTERVVVIPAMEVGLVARKTDALWDRRCHFLFIGGSVEDNTYDQVMQWASAYTTEKGAVECLKKLTALAQERGALLVAAHPTNSGWLIDSSLLELVNGIEAMNHDLLPGASIRGDTPENLLKTMPAVPSSPVVTAGLDWHGVIGQSGFRDIFRRFTVVLTDERTPTGIVGALQARRSYAALGDARITRGKELIGGEVGFDQPFEMGFEGVRGNKAWLVCRSSDSAYREFKPVSLKSGTLNIKNLGKALGPAMTSGGWIVVAAPAGTPQIITSGIKVNPAEAGGGEPSFVFYDKPLGPGQLARPKKPGFWDQVRGGLGDIVAGALSGGMDLPGMRIRITPGSSMPGEGIPQVPAGGTVPQGGQAGLGEDFSNWPMEYSGVHPTARGQTRDQVVATLYVNPEAQQGLLAFQLNDLQQQIPVTLPGVFGNGGFWRSSWQSKLPSRPRFMHPQPSSLGGGPRPACLEGWHLGHSYRDKNDPATYHFDLTLRALADVPERVPVAVGYWEMRMELLRVR
ncbi:MAG: hypothetical protein OEV37_02230 [Candidatus Berkelbacteria bacterium]|nr:hypothetical protein [Candidatus Berkelbacteria bacterium]